MSRCFSGIRRFRFQGGTQALDDIIQGGERARKAREARQPTHARLIDSFAKGDDEEQLQKGLAFGVSLKSLQPDGADTWSSWHDGQEGKSGQGCKRGGLAVYSPHEPEPNAYVFFIHGGAFEHYSPTDGGYDSLCSRLAAAANVTVVCPDHPLSGEGRLHTGPAIMESLEADLHHLIKHVAGTCKDMTDKLKIVIAGDSSGGNQALGLLLHLLHRNSSAVSVLKGIALISPWLDITCGSPTYISNTFSELYHTGDALFRRSPKENRQEFRDFGVRYAGAELRNPIFSPYWVARAPPDDHLLQALLEAGLPLWMCVGAAEVLMGEVLDFAERLHGRLPMEVWLHDAMWHDWIMYGESFPSKDANMRVLADFLKRLLEERPLLHSGIHYYIDEWAEDDMWHAHG